MQASDAVSPDRKSKDVFHDVSTAGKLGMSSFSDSIATFLRKEATRRKPEEIVMAKEELKSR